MKARSHIKICHDATANVYAFVVIFTIRRVLKRNYTRRVLQKAKIVTAFSAKKAVIKVHIGILVCLNILRGRIRRLNVMICRVHYWHDSTSGSGIVPMGSHSIHNYAITIF